MQTDIFVKSIGPMTAPSPKGPTATIPFRIEFETADGRAILSLSPTVVAELRAELDLWLKARGFQ